jgi:hypothetical protein
MLRSVTNVDVESCSVFEDTGYEGRVLTLGYSSA